jgi:hypothetical protein
MSPLGKAGTENRLAYLLRTCRVDTALQLIELEASWFKPQAAEFEDAAHIRFEILYNVFVKDSQYSPRKHRVPVTHQLEIAPIVTANVINAIGEFLSASKQLLQVSPLRC